MQHIHYFLMFAGYRRRSHLARCQRRRSSRATVRVFPLERYDVFSISTQYISLFSLALPYSSRPLAVAVHSRKWQLSSRLVSKLARVRCKQAFCEMMGQTYHPYHLQAHSRQRMSDAFDSPTRLLTSRMRWVSRRKTEVRWIVADYREQHSRQQLESRIILTERGEHIPFSLVF